MKFDNVAVKEKPETMSRSSVKLCHNSGCALGAEGACRMLILVSSHSLPADKVVVCRGEQE